MRYYEMLFIVHPNYEQDRLDAVISSVQKEITSQGGTILKTDNWGKRKLSYLINKQRYGSYVLMYFETDPSKVQEIYQWMEIQAQILHQIVIRLDEKPELSDESQNPDSSSASYAKPSSFVKKDKEEADSGDDKLTSDDDDDIDDDIDDDTEEAVEEVEKKEEAEETAEEAVEEKAEETAEEAPAEESTEEDKESASAEAAADKKGE